MTTSRHGAARLIDALFPPAYPGRSALVAIAHRLDAAEPDGAGALLAAWSAFKKGDALPSAGLLRDLVVGLADLLALPAELRLRPRMVHA